MPEGDGAELKISANDVLRLERCPHCSIANPGLTRVFQSAFRPGRVPAGTWEVLWSVYVCTSCAGLIAAGYGRDPNPQRTLTSIGQIRAPLVTWIIPWRGEIYSALPSAVSHYLKQATETINSPSASVVMAASAVDAMLKERNLRTGSLFSRIEEAAASGLITEEMAALAHDVRLDANNERHADPQAALATAADAQRCLEFAEALAEMMFVLPARVKRANG